VSSVRDVSESCWVAECEGDIDAIMEHFHDDATYYAPDGPRTGIKALREMYAYYADLQGPVVSVEILKEFTNADEGAIEFEAVRTDASGKRFRVRGVQVAQVQDGRFTYVRAYEDPLIPE
jgi:ketosteroid isomerase-like protein